MNHDKWLSHAYSSLCDSSSISQWLCPGLPSLRTHNTVRYKLRGKHIFHTRIFHGYCKASQMKREVRLEDWIVIRSARNGELSKGNVPKKWCKRVIPLVGSVAWWCLIRTISIHLLSNLVYVSSLIDLLFHLPWTVMSILIYQVCNLLQIRYIERRPICKSNLPCCIRLHI